MYLSNFNSPWPLFLKGGKIKEIYMVIENFDIPNELNINDNNNYINLDEDNGNSFNLRDNSLNKNMKIDDYFK